MCLSIAIHRPNDVLATGEHAGFQWQVIHNGNGYRCGYVRVPVGHPWHGKDYGDIDGDVEVHGGLTFSDSDEPCDKGQPDDGHWFGFDCGHSGDQPDPALPRTRPLDGPTNAFKSIFDDNSYGEIRTQPYVEAECRSLCEQAARKSRDVNREHASAEVLQAGV